MAGLQCVKKELGTQRDGRRFRVLRWEQAVVQCVGDEGKAGTKQYCVALQAGRNDKLEETQKWLIARVLKLCDLAVPFLHKDIVSEAWLKWMWFMKYVGRLVSNLCMAIRMGCGGRCEFVDGGNALCGADRRHPLLKGGDIWTPLVVTDEGVATSLVETRNVRWCFSCACEIDDWAYPVSACIWVWKHVWPEHLHSQPNRRQTLDVDHESLRPSAFLQAKSFRRYFERRRRIKSHWVPPLHRIFLFVLETTPWLTLGKRHGRRWWKPHANWKASNNEAAGTLLSANLRETEPSKKTAHILRQQEDCHDEDGACPWWKWKHHIISHLPKVKNITQRHSGARVLPNFFSQQSLALGYGKELYHIGFAKYEKGLDQNRGRQAVHFTLVNTWDKKPLKNCKDYTHTHTL